VPSAALVHPEHRAAKYRKTTLAVVFLYLMCLSNENSRFDKFAGSEGPTPNLNPFRVQKAFLTANLIVNMVTPTNNSLIPRNTPITTVPAKVNPV
jgi:hypothetical protein